jgi:hypothetical protein
MSKVPTDPAARELFIQQISTDTGAFCRLVLGMDTDRDQKGGATSEVGKGGVRSWGPHAEVTRFLDDWDPQRPFKHLMCPRFAYKSSMVEGLICRALLFYPNICILMMMASKEDAAHRVAVIRDILMNNEVIRELFPDFDCKGSKYAFTTSLRDNLTLQTPSLRAGSPQNVPTGGRYNLIVFDDLADDVNTRTEEGLRKGIDTVKASIFLRGTDAIVLNVATPRHDGDVSAWLNEEEGWAKCTHLDVGFDLVQDEHGKLRWHGENQVWPHLSREFLNSQIQGLGGDYGMLMAQYKLRVVAGLHSAFRRSHFQGFAFKDSVHWGLTGYLLTDVATSVGKDSCLNVLMYVGVDERHRIYILDLEIGRWEMMQFCSRFMAMRARWSGRVNHQAELLEQTAANHGYAAFLRQSARDQGTRLNIINVSRTSATKSKDMRILGTQVRFQSREVFVNNELSGKTTIIGDQIREVWNPEGYCDQNTGVREPDGELVMQFIRHPFHRFKDIPDTFALVDEIDRETGRLTCFWRKPSARHNTVEAIRQPVVKQGPGKGYTTRIYERFQRGSARSQPWPYRGRGK